MQHSEMTYKAERAENMPVPKTWRKLIVWRRTELETKEWNEIKGKSGRGQGNTSAKWHTHLFFIYICIYTSILITVYIYMYVYLSFRKNNLRKGVKIPWFWLLQIHGVQQDFHTMVVQSDLQKIFLDYQEDALIFFFIILLWMRQRAIPRLSPLITTQWH